MLLIYKCWHRNRISDTFLLLSFLFVSRSSSLSVFWYLRYVFDPPTTISSTLVILLQYVFILWLIDFYLRSIIIIVIILHLLFRPQKNTISNTPPRLFRDYFYEYFIRRNTRDLLIDKDYALIFIDSVQKILKTSC